MRRIFRDYSTGLSPKRIALTLNAETVPGPRGGAWSSSTINGNRARGTGILNNELYVGRLAWNRLTYAKDPETGRRRSRARRAEDHVVTAVPDLRIIDQELWDTVRARQSRLDERLEDAGGSGLHERSNSVARPFWSKQRPRHLFSGLMRCGVCGGGFCQAWAAGC